MYLQFYGLKENPFNTTPDPRFFVFTNAYRQTLVQLEQGVTERRGYLLLTGDVGTGKTTLLRTLLERLDETIESACVINSMLSFDEILEYVVEDFGLAGATRAQRLFALNRFVTARTRENRNTLLIIDEAHHLDVAGLEQIRLLSDYEASPERPLQILLVGQPELARKLGSSELRHLQQRIGLRCVIRPLTPQEVAHYVRHRLAVARDSTFPGSPREIFPADTIVRIAAHSRGVPRVVNALCEQCLLIGFADQKAMIDRATLAEAARYLETDVRPTRARTVWWRPAAANRWLVPTAIGTVVGCALFLALAPENAVSLVDRLAVSLEAVARAARSLVGDLFGSRLLS